MSIIFITLTNTGYIDYTLNCLKSLERVGFDKYPLHCYCIGDVGAARLAARGYSCSLVGDEKDSNFQTYRKGNWSNITSHKFDVIHQNLQKYEYVCITDGDIVYERNDFMEYLVGNIGTNDMLIQHEFNDTHDRPLCSGFMFIRSNSKTLSIFDPTCVEGHKDTVGWDDQVYINEIRHTLSYKLLPADLFPNGAYYYTKGAPNPYLVHFNWVEGHEKKDKMKNYDKWFV